MDVALYCTRSRKEVVQEFLDMSGKLNCYTKERYGQEYDREYFYTGICDLSYINIEDPEEQRKADRTHHRRYRLYAVIKRQ